MAKYDWFYMSNPAGATVGYGIREESFSAMLGAFAVFPRRLSVNDRERLGGITGDFGVHPRHRVLRPALNLQKLVLANARQEGIEILYGFPNRLSEPVQKRVGYRIIGRVVRVSKILRSYSRLKKRFDLPFITRLLAALIDFAGWLVSRESYSRSPRNCRSVLLDSFDQRFDRLWSKVRCSYPVLGIRDQSFLNWRFTACPYKSYRVFALEDTHSHDLVGYIVYHQTDNDLIIADMLATDQDHLRSLLSTFIRYGRHHRNSAVTMTFISGPDLLDLFRSLQFRIRPTEGNVLAYVDENDPQAEILQNGDNWYLTEGDNDV